MKFSNISDVPENDRESVKAGVPTVLDTIEKIKPGHFPFLSQVDGMVEILKRAAVGKVVV